MNFSRIGLILVFALAIKTICGQENGDFSSDLKSIRTLVSTIKDKLDLEKDTKTECYSIVSQVKSLEELYRLNGKKGESLLYRSTLQPYMRTLEEYVASRRINARLITTIHQLNDELRIKLIFARNQKGGFFSDIEVSIDTQVSGKPSRGYEVWFLAQGWESHVDHAERFDILSTPASKKIPPGSYFIWVTKGKYKSPWTSFTFGEDGLNKRWIELGVGDEKSDGKR